MTTRAHALVSPAAITPAAHAVTLGPDVSLIRSTVAAPDGVCATTSRGTTAPCSTRVGPR